MTNCAKHSLFHKSKQDPNLTSKDSLKKSTFTTEPAAIHCYKRPQFTINNNSKNPVHIYPLLHKYMYQSIFIWIKCMWVCKKWLNNPKVIEIQVELNRTEKLKTKFRTDLAKDLKDSNLMSLCRTVLEIQRALCPKVHEF